MYEAQFLARFFKWLRDGNLPGDYKNPTHLWIDEVLLGLGPVHREFRGNGFETDYLWTEMSIGIGGYHDPGRLVLADNGMNGKKGNFFPWIQPQCRHWPK